MNLGFPEKHIPTLYVKRVWFEFQLTLLPMFTQGPWPISKSLFYLANMNIRLVGNPYT